MYFIHIGILHYHWCVGSHPGHCDIVGTSDHDGTVTDVILENVLDGHHCFITIQVRQYFYVTPLWGRHIGLLWFAVSRHRCLCHLADTISGKLLDPGLSNIYI